MTACVSENLTCRCNKAHKIGSRNHKHLFKKNLQNYWYYKDVCKILNQKHIARVIVLGEAKSEPQAYYTVIVGVFLVFTLSFYHLYLWKFIIPYLGSSPDVILCG